ncbi:evolutionarily conserved signaling intermediate in Toll pathway, mitochondrial-like [Patiria miniata]|uniref:Evolutionarily conserved signaling intermediate in Toll pathway, mitochondrial n=1 Tax=Patiria miniata TaxID=46514 RepID=A0A914ASZ2_PATMI|nr:evolutionarily conserved signaling intermediate in Toll pathway, mitochondrial-like [Patiria miniata]XP_038067170.1 evolutionarily conserved signaling intermediate in Toll pathway, mitochondrial-like [Patiria miniata]XP_038067171.1 evolutionarily conserved signaling intermediate in Toll pathway, mitochondrial-like [Patiria miniata]XP_038067173.1 evolutionarily conserved signaling intermediate in Toll pathway, mitochondrial-like [Patiria miniata]XP_038067174.1 evolutionarily conserved signali
MATIKFLRSAIYHLSASRLPATRTVLQQSALQTKIIVGPACHSAQIHTCQQRRAEIGRGNIHPSKLEKSSLAISKTLFEEATLAEVNKETFRKVVKTFTEYDKRRRGHIQFIETALRYMKDFRVEKDVDAYNALLDVFPKGKYVPENVIQSIYNHFPEQQICAIKVLQMMEDNTVLPNNETKDILISVFGKRAHPVKKYQRLMYWFPKFRNINPFPLPKELPTEPTKLSEIGLKRIAEYEAELKVYYLNGTTAESENAEFIANAQSPEQRELLAEHPPVRPLYVEGAFHLWLRSSKLTYFVLRGDPFALGDEGASDQDVPQTHAEGPVFAMCMTNSNSQETLQSWIKNLQEDNPHLARIPVIFNLFNLGESRTEPVRSLPTETQLIGDS